MCYSIVQKTASEGDLEMSTFSKKWPGVAYFLGGLICALIYLSILSELYGKSKTDEIDNYLLFGVIIGISIISFTTALVFVRLIPIRALGILFNVIFCLATIAIVMLRPWDNSASAAEGRMWAPIWMLGGAPLVVPPVTGASLAAHFFVPIRMKLNDYWYR